LNKRVGGTEVRSLGARKTSMQRGKGDRLTEREKTKRRNPRVGPKGASVSGGVQKFRVAQRGGGRDEKRASKEKALVFFWHKPAEKPLGGLTKDRMGGNKEKQRWGGKKY